MSSLPAPRRAALAAIGAFVALELGYGIWVAFVAHGPIGPRVGYGPDSALYIAAARAPVWSRRFVAGPGPFGFLLLAKLCARNLRAIVVAQTVLAIGAWTFLATTVAGLARTTVARWVGLVAILGLALAPGVLQWNAFVTTESLSLSLLATVVATGLRLVRRGERRDLVWFVVAIAAFANTRDTNALVVGVLGVVALVCAFRPVARRRGLVVAVAGIVLALTGTALAGAAQPPRWYWPLAETTSIRLLADPGATRYLVDHGFPLDARTRSLPTTYFFVVGHVTDLHDPTYAPFRAWLHRRGRSTYVGFLASHPWWALRKPFDDRTAFFDLRVIQGYGRGLYHDRPGVPFAAIGAVAAPISPGFAEIWAAVAALALALLFARRAIGRALAGAVALTGALAVVGYYSAWHGDALEGFRHALTANIELRVTLWLVTVLAVDALLARARGGSVVEVPGETGLDEHEHQRAPAAGEPREQPAASAAAGRVAQAVGEGHERDECGDR